MDELTTLQAYLEHFKRLVNRAGCMGPPSVNFKVNIVRVDSAIAKMGDYAKGIMAQWFDDCNEMMELIYKWAPSDWVIHRQSLLSQLSLARAMAASTDAMKAASGATFLLSWMQIVKGHASPTLIAKWRAATDHANDFCTVCLQLKMILVDIPAKVEATDRKAAALAYRSELQNPKKKTQDLVLCVCPVFLSFFLSFFLSKTNNNKATQHQDLAPDLKLRLDQLCDGSEVAFPAVQIVPTQAVPAAEVVPAAKDQVVPC